MRRLTLICRDTNHKLITNLDETKKINPYLSRHKPQTNHQFSLVFLQAWRVICPGYVCRIVKDWKCDCWT
ncbi:hypothetical protein HanIR_Chr01g0006531 [Helianthus annuus]|nr:hypothetical protein HanIR_Chr01g0006531 [Helianthus annuus]